jgi:hypothetical protein
MLVPNDDRISSRTCRSASDACQASLAPSYVYTGSFGLRAPARLARLASSRGDSSHDDASGDKERAVRAAFACHLALVRAIVVELSPGRCDGAPRGPESSSRDRDSTTTCGTFAPGLGTTPEDAPAPFGPFGRVLSPQLGGRRSSSQVSVSRYARNRVFSA